MKFYNEFLQIFTMKLLFDGCCDQNLEVGMTIKDYFIVTEWI